MPRTMQCSVKLLVKPWDPPELVPTAARLPWVVSFGAVLPGCLGAVWAMGLMMTGVLPPPRYSGRWSLASGDVTPKWALRISV